MWRTKELPLVTFGGHQVVAKLTKAPENTNKPDKSFEDKNIDELVKTIQSEPIVFMNPPVISFKL
jgi:hypothetical protein